MLTAKDIMTTKVVTVTPETEITTAAKMLLDDRFNGLPVVDESGSLVGIVCQSDIIAQHKNLNLPSFFTVLDGLIPLHAMSDIDEQMRRIAAVNVGEAMTAHPVTITSTTGIDEIASLMVDANYHTLPVVDEGRLVGIVGKEDLLRTLAGA